jgi:hypothetical protein
MSQSIQFLPNNRDVRHEIYAAALALAAFAAFLVLIACAVATLLLVIGFAVVSVWR